MRFNMETVEYNNMFQYNNDLIHFNSLLTWYNLVQH